MDLIPKTHISGRSIAVMFLAGETGIEEWLASRVDFEVMEKLKLIREGLQSMSAKPLSYIISQQRMAKVDEILDDGALRVEEIKRGRNLSQTLGRWAMHPVLGFPILLIVLYLTYKSWVSLAPGRPWTF